MSFNVKVLKAAHGDCILISGVFDDGIFRNILIDGGPSKAYEYRQFKGELFNELSKINKQQQVIDLLIITHVDDDHIGGLLKGFKNDGLLSLLTKKVWFNSGKLINEYFNQQENENLIVLNDSGEVGYTSIRQGVDFEEIIERKGIWDKNIIMASDIIHIFGIKFTFLSPNEDQLSKLLGKWEKEQPNSLTSSTHTDYDKTLLELIESDIFEEDNTIHNGSSLAFIFEYKNKRALLLGDARDSVIVNNLKKLLKLGESNRFDLIKLSHHGSKYNTSIEFLRIVDCDKYIISTDGSKHGLPNKVTLARVYSVKPMASIFFNYPNVIDSKIFKKCELEDLENKKFNILDGTIEF
ncbi:ComEC/Rec2 family competence protein [Photobacterium carnosum]|uniref:Metallo-beta-lactamase domain-containing protein n=1 Tax=Photobacterium carnosum TaxID=2023717 RepID=A0A2N4UQR5_9GAMM|nr:MBL fold metallo-hydrolase [Photobacterium carnosum]PLC57360.1 hypothetical protein CIK00_13800 [Photobacterium carnosum]